MGDSEKLANKRKAAAMLRRMRSCLWNAFVPFTRLSDVGFFTAVVAIIAGLQWNTLEKTDETSRAGLRPYISGVAINVDSQRYPLTWDLSVILENSGGTPPLEMQYVIRSSPELPLDPEDVFQRPSATDAFFWSTIAPKGRTQIYGGGPPSSFFESGAKTWYVSGAIHYRDQFQGTPERVSKFCFGVLATKDFKANVMRPAYDPCPYWNCVDQNACIKDRERYDLAVKAAEVHPIKNSSDTPEVPIGTSLPHFPIPIVKAK